ncbi:MAG: DUF1643 domain-containing protein [Lachnospiraceae bacterium]|nr:DUF1643 domain-containing protein [Lachnospiraceae bacterium]
MANKSVVHTLKTEIIGNATNTYEIVKESVEGKQKEAVVIQLYPTIGINEIGILDTTTMHLQNKMHQLGWSKVHILNLFSQIIKRKPLSADLPSVDDKNLKYVMDVLKKLQDSCDIVIAWGNSHTTSKVVNESKRQLLENLQTLKKASASQIVAEHMLTESAGTHILFLGLRYADDTWMLEDYPIADELERISLKLNTPSDMKKKDTKEKAMAKKEKIDE